MTTVMMNMLEPLFLLWTQTLPNFLIVFFYLQWCAVLGWLIEDVTMIMKETS